MLQKICNKKLPFSSEDLEKVKALDNNNKCKLMSMKEDKSNMKDQGRKKQNVTERKRKEIESNMKETDKNMKETEFSRSMLSKNMKETESIN